MKHHLKIIYNPYVIDDLQNVIDYYFKETGNDSLGKRFLNTVHRKIKTLSASAYHYQIRYDDIRCLPLHSFPYMIHFRIDEFKKVVKVDAIYHTSLDPEKWKERK